MVQTKSDRDKQKLITDKCQSLIEVLLKDEDNKYCVDCDAKGPRWASWNLGIFLCIRCAGIHRNLGVHISRVKSVNLDAWTPDHVAYVQRMGNSKARAIYEANLPDDFRRPQTDTALESFIRAKYEHKRYIDPDYVDPGPPAPAFNAEEELRRIKEQKRSKLNSGSNKTMISVSDSFAPAASSASKQITPASNSNSSASKSRPSPQQPQQQQPSLLMASEALASSVNMNAGNNSTSTSTSTKPKSNLADLMDLDLGFGSNNLIGGNISSSMVNPLNPLASSVNTSSLNNNNISTTFNNSFSFDSSPLAGSVPSVETATAAVTTTTAAAAAAATPAMNFNNINSSNNQPITGSTGKNVFDLLDI